MRESGTVLHGSRCTASVRIAQSPVRFDSGDGLYSFHIVMSSCAISIRDLRIRLKVTDSSVSFQFERKKRTPDISAECSFSKGGLYMVYYQQCDKMTSLP